MQICSSIDAVKYMQVEEDLLVESEEWNLIPFKGSYVTGTLMFLTFISSVMGITFLLLIFSKN
jgi:hypothetical protein